MEGPVVPRQLNYNDVLPVAIESKSNKRTFEPSNGNKFSPGSNSIIRLNINSDNLCDFTHSFLQFTVVNNTVAKTNGTMTDSAEVQTTALMESATMLPDHGVPFFKRVQILSGGQELEDISEHGRLYSILQSIQGNPEQENDLSLTSGRTDFKTSGLQAVVKPTVADGNNDAASTTLETQAAVDALTDHINGLQMAMNQENPYLHNGRGGALVNQAVSVEFGKGPTSEPGIGLRSTNHTEAGETTDYDPSSKKRTQLTYNINLISAILNNSKYFPLLFTNMGLDIYLHLEDAINVGAWDVVTANASDKYYSITPDYEINNVKYHAHLVDVDRSFYDRMRMAMSQAGGVIQLSGTTYKHYIDTFTESSDTHNVQVSTRVKSLNALLVRPQRQELNNQTKSFCISTGEGCGINEYAFRVGSVQYPQRPVSVSSTNMGESYSELKKVFGVLGNYTHNNYINKSTFIRTSRDCNRGSCYSFFTAAYGFEGFSKSASESGLNVSDRALSVVCEIKRSVNGVDKAIAKDITTDAIKANGTFDTKECSNIRYDIFAMTDMIIYITADGSISTRV